MKSENYHNAFQNCLERILQDGERLDVVVSDYPKWRERLADDLGAATRLGEAGKSIQPRREYIPTAKKYILEQIGQEIKPNNFWDQLFNTEIQPAARYVTILLAIIIFSIVNGGLIIASDRSLPGDRLYPLRHISESITLVLTFDNAREAVLQQRMAQDYLVACADLVSQGRSEDALEALRKYEIYISGTGRQLLEISQSGNGELSQMEANFSRLYLQDLETLQVILPDVY